MWLGEREFTTSSVCSGIVINLCIILLRYRMFVKFVHVRMENDVIINIELNNNVLFDYIY